MKYLPVFFVPIAIFLVITAFAASPPSVTTQMYDNSHTGWNPSETQLTVANASNLQLLFTDTTDASTYAQPLYVPALNLGSLGTHNVIFVATENNSVYAFDADRAGSPLWSTNLTPSGETLQVSNDYNNDRIPAMGISGTPVIDSTSNTLYVIAASKTTSTPTVFHQRLHALDITTGAERPNSPVDIKAAYPGSGGIQDGKGNVVFEPLVQFNRAALMLFGNDVYTAWSAHEDNGYSADQSAVIGNGIYQGWVIAYDKTSLAQVAVYNDAPNLPSGTGGGSIWQGSMGLVADSSSIYALTANGLFDSNGDYGDSALRLTPGLAVADSFTACNQAELDDLDVDLGSGGMLILPQQSTSPSQLITFAGKEGSIYLVDRTAMGGYTPTTVADNVPCTDNVVQKLWRVLGTAATNGNSNRDAYWGAPAYFADSSGHQYVYYTGDYSPIKEYDLANATLTAGIAPNGNPNQTASSEYNFAHGGTIPVISSNGGDPTTAVLWAIRRPLPPSHGTGTLTLDAYSATNLTNQLIVDIPAGSWTYTNDAFVIPTVVNGKVYVSSAGQLDVFGLGASPSPTPTPSVTPTPTSTPTGMASPTPTPAAVQITAPANKATVSGTVTISITKPATTSWVNVYIDGAYFASTPPSTFSWNSTAVANGQHTISANGYASGGTFLGSTTVTVTVENSVATPTPTPAAVSINAPQNSATVSGTVAVTVALGSKTSWVDVYVDGTYFASTPPVTFNWNSATVANGSHTLSATAFSSSGTVLGSAAVNVTVQNNATPTPTSISTPVSTPTPIMTPAPTVTATMMPTPAPTAVAITAPMNDATVSGTVPITVTIGSQTSWINVYIDGNYFASTPPTTFNWNSTSVTNGQHTISATAFSSTGGVAGTASVVVTVDNSAAVGITTPTQGATVSGTAVTITVAKSTNVSWENVYIDGVYFASTPPSTFAWNSTTVADGSHTISVTGYSSSSTVLGTASVTVTVAN